MKVRLGDICEILDHKRVPVASNCRVNGPYPYYGANGIQGHISDFIFDDELVLVAEDGGNFDNKNKPIAYRVSGKCWVNNHAHVLKPKENVDVDYLCYSLMYKDVSKVVNGATRKKLTKSSLVNLEIPLPNMQRQRVIVQILNYCFKLIQNYQKSLCLLDELVKSREVEQNSEVAA